MNKSNSRSKISTIAKSYLEEKPVNEKWYQDRIAACLACEFNTKNIEKDNLDLVQKVVKKTFEDGQCSLCGCPVANKCSRRTEKCANLENPRWESLEAESTRDKKMSILFENTELATLYEFNKVMNFDFKGFQDVLKLNFKIQRKGGLSVKSVIPGCSCTVPTVKPIDSETTEIETLIFTDKFRTGLTQRTMSVYYYIDTNKVIEIPIQFNITKP